ncbi:LptF/LptG family permease [Paucibacter soli]|uniref:LptF/LptG family permease n=1 Tax=Paucibacter soli TaxID=3133433 RepID=UPI0030B6B72E
MRTVRRLLYRDVFGAVSFVMLGFLSLFFFVDFVDDLDRMNRVGAGAAQAAWLSLLKVPGNIYELAPFAILIGTIYSLARLAQSSEFTILRTAGLGPGRALGLLASLALMFAALTFVIGDYIAPLTGREAMVARARNAGAAVSESGAWLKDKLGTADGEWSYSVHVQRARAGGLLEQIRIFEFDAHGGLVTRLSAERATVSSLGVWTLEGVSATQWRQVAGPLLSLAPGVLAGAGPTPSPTDLREYKLAQLPWHSSLTLGVVTAAVLPAANMSTLELYRYTEHLSAQEQSAQAHNIQFWRKAFYPIACMVMVALALPFAYLHGRAGGISLKVFGGIMLGISFVLINNLAGHLGLLKNWTPWAVAAAPSLFYMGISLAAFGWLVRYR